MKISVPKKDTLNMKDLGELHRYGDSNQAYARTRGALGKMECVMNNFMMHDLIIYERHYLLLSSVHIESEL